jgi:alpha,alpha-trehalose phosphorylase
MVAGFGGMRDHGDTLSFAPRLPDALKGLRFRLTYRNRQILVELTTGSARYVLVDGEPLSLVHHGEAFELTAEEPATLACPAAAVDRTSR